MQEIEWAAPQEFESGGGVNALEGGGSIQENTLTFEKGGGVNDPPPLLCRLRLGER